MLGKKLTKQQIERYKNMFIEMYEMCDGTFTSAINKLNIEFPNININWRNYYYQWRKEDEDFKTKLELIDIRRTAWVENKLMENIEMGFFPAIKFYLQAKGGWSEKTEQVVTHNLNEPIKITIHKPDDGK